MDRYQVIWSGFAEEKLDEIHDYYLNKAGENVASTLVVGIILAANSIISQPLRGQVEKRIKIKGNEFRYLVYKSYKLIYSVDNQRKLIKISDVFDARQNPDKTDRSVH
ncbi:MAG: type II toxin-antitoxin system RelE/ParE family toxin [Bacteroidia bacterium]